MSREFGIRKVGIKHIRWIVLEGPICEGGYKRIASFMNSADAVLFAIAAGKLIDPGRDIARPLGQVIDRLSEYD